MLNNPLANVDPLGLHDDCVGPCSGFSCQENGCTVIVSYYVDDIGYDEALIYTYCPAEGPVAVSSGGGAGRGGRTQQSAPNNAQQNWKKTQQCVSGFYNSIPGKAVQFGSPLSLLPVWNPGYGNNLKEWGVAIVGNLGGLFGSGATPGTNQLTTLSGTKTIGSAPELAIEGTLGAIEKVATPAMALATVADIMAHGTCAMIADPAAANAARQSVP